MPRTVEIDDDIYEFLRGNVRAFRETESAVLRRLFNLPEAKARTVPPTRPGPEPSPAVGPVGQPLPQITPEEWERLTGTTMSGEALRTQPAVPPEPTPSVPPVVVESPLMRFVADPSFRRRTATDKFLRILGFACREDPAKFERVLDISGRRRKYFGRSREEVEKSGTSTHPRPIPGSTYWAMTNADTRQKCDMLKGALEVLGYSAEDIRAAGKAVF